VPLRERQQELKHSHNEEAGKSDERIVSVGDIQMNNDARRAEVGPVPKNVLDELAKIVDNGVSLHQLPNMIHEGGAGPFVGCPFGRLLNFREQLKD
jgi:hypothetical protein